MVEYDDDDGKGEGEKEGRPRVNNLDMAIQTSALARDDKRRFHPPFAAHANARKSYSKSNHFNRKLGCSTARKCKKSRKKKKKKAVDSAASLCTRLAKKSGSFIQQESRGWWCNVWRCCCLHSRLSPKKSTCVRANGCVGNHPLYIARPSLYRLTHTIGRGALAQLKRAVITGDGNKAS